jgi:hypothetical protein
MSAAVVSLTAFVLSVYASRASFTSTHAILGLVVYIMSLAQIGWALLRPNKPPASSLSQQESDVEGALDVSAAPASATRSSTSLRRPWEMCHRYSAIVLLLMSWATMVLGYRAYGLDSLPAIIIPIASTLLAIVIAVCVQYRLITFYRSESQAQGTNGSQAGSIGSAKVHAGAANTKRTTRRGRRPEPKGLEIPTKPNHRGSRVDMQNPVSAF